jgi:uncharacterized protein VirK/YbjX
LQLGAWSVNFSADTLVIFFLWYSVTMAPSTAEQYVSLVESLLAGTVHLVRRTCSTNISHLTSRFRKFVGDETIFAALAGHFEVVRVLRRTGARALTARYPNYCHKYLSGYLAKSFGKKLRRKVLIFHHEFLAKKLSEKLYGRILLDGLVLWSETIEGNSYSISLSFDPWWHAEGDLSLTFNKNGFPLYTTSFTIIPGHIVGCAEQVLFIARVQGAQNHAQEIRLSTRACYDIAPANLLFATVQSIATALAIKAIVGVSDQEQLSNKSGGTGLAFSYNLFWDTHLMQRTAGNVYLASVPFAEKPMEEIKAVHRRRARKKRTIKKQIANAVGAAFTSQFHKVGNPSPCPDHSPE